jgi:phage shock protein E
MGILSWLGFGNNGLKKALESGTTIVDVRTPHEFDQGKIPGSINIPVDRLSSQINKLKSINTPIVLCCASGMRAGMAKSVLKKAGIKDVHNGGGWQSLMRKL